MRISKRIASAPHNAGASNQNSSDTRIPIDTAIESGKRQYFSDKHAGRTNKAGGYYRAGRFMPINALNTAIMWRGSTRHCWCQSDGSEF